MPIRAYGNDGRSMLTSVTGDIARAFSAIEPQASEPRLSPNSLGSLRGACCAAFDDDIHPDVLDLVARYCEHVNETMEGRAAGNLDDFVIRYLFRYYACRVDIRGLREACHMEIGALFGAATIFACHATSLAGSSIPIVVVDPLNGYYGKGVDPLTKLDVCEDRFWQNLERFGARRHQIELVRGLSTDPSTIRRCLSKHVVSILIDGDHTYDGIRSDWLNLSPLVVIGGYALIDDYQSPSWPDVERYVNSEILPQLGERWRVRLAFGKSLLLQRAA